MGLQVDPGVVWNSNVFIYITHPQQCVQTDRQFHELVFAPAAPIDATPTDWFPHQRLLFESVSWNLGAKNWLAILIFLVEIDHILVLFIRVITHVLKMLQVEGAAIDMGPPLTCILGDSDTQITGSHAIYKLVHLLIEDLRVAPAVSYRRAGDVLPSLLSPHHCL